MPLTYCGNIVRQADPDRFLISLLMSRKNRDALWALFAFNTEIAKTRSVVTETTTGLIRLTWWREAIEEIYNNETPRSHPIVEDLARVIKKHDLDKQLFLKVLYAREFDLEDVPPASVDGLKLYAQETNAPLMALALQVLNQNETQVTLNAVATSYEVVKLIRSVPQMLSMRRCMLPSDVLAKYNLSPQKLFDFNQQDKIPKVIKEVLSAEIENHNEQSRFLKAHTLVSQMYVKQIQAVHYDLFDPRLHAPPAFMALRLWVQLWMTR